MAKAASIPRFGLDKGQYGTLILGHRFMGDLTQSDVKAIHKTTDGFRKKTGLPLVFVNPGPAEADAEDTASETFFAGLLLASAKEGGKPTTVDKALLDSSKLDTIPSAFWEELEEKHGLSLEEGDDDEEDEEEGEEDEDDEDDDGPSIGIFLAPAGWAVASLFVGSTDGDPLTTTSSEDTSIGKHLSEEQIASIRESADPLLLVGAYC